MFKQLTGMAAALLLAGTVHAQITNGNFENGDLSGWTVEGDGWTVQGPDYTGQGSTTKQGSYFATTLPSGENATGTLKSPNLSVPTDKSMLSFLVAGHSQYPAQTAANAYNYVSIKKASDNSEIARVYAPGADNLTDKNVDLSAYKGQQVYIQVVDDGDLSAQGLSGFGWIAVDDFTFTSAPSVRVVIDDFESGAFDTAKWTVEGSWEVVTAGQGYGAAPSHGNNCAKSSYDRANNASADALTGTLTSKPFGINPHDTFLKFDMCGHDGTPTDPLANEVYVELYLATDPGTPVARLAPPRQDAFKTMMFDVTPYQGKQVILKFVDNRTGGFGWTGVDYIRIENDGVPVELSSFSAE